MFTGNFGMDDINHVAFLCRQSLALVLTIQNKQEKIHQKHKIAQNKQTGPGLKNTHTKTKN